MNISETSSTMHLALLSVLITTPYICTDHCKIKCHWLPLGIRTSGFLMHYQVQTRTLQQECRTLSRLPMDIDSYMKLCTENVSQGDMKECCVGVGAQRRGETVCVSAISNNSSLLNMEEVSLGSSVDEISKRSLLDAQKQDQVIGRLVTFLKTNRWPKPWEIKRKLPATKVLLRQRRKLYCDEDGLLFTRSGPYS